ncbi:T9SS type A sorting domain-containing protein [Draconibacterium sp. IB214405]|uniref:T9SS type A sorting domain-containing protein n=1 Tax=Draconibacterium sp. IB214405 TaxID=3097352 RepID=UPI002A0F77DE|nr:T9SS type A sorting domain-containing protein [Draconibacterium sp. IB214405]MDX8340365.1 T9SS type A sorting domain-containing protein [Draconibacterium sp. IB214405]
MKHSLLLLFTLFCFHLAIGQKITINSPIVATAGNKTEVKMTASPVNISKWRIGEIYLVTLPETDLDDQLRGDSRLKVFPNPFRDEVNVQLKTDVTGVYRLLVTDISGRQQFYNSEETIIPGQSVQINLSHLRPAVYILTLYNANTDTKWMVKIQKQ